MAERRLPANAAGVGEALGPAAAEVELAFQRLEPGHPVPERLMAGIAELLELGGHRGSGRRPGRTGPAIARRRASRREQRDGQQEARLVAIACSTPPVGKARWTLKMLADRLVELEVVDAVSDETVRRTLKKTR